MDERRRRFVDEFILTGNGAEAARRAGYSAKHANRQAHALLSNPQIRAAIDERLQAASTAKTLEQTELLEFMSAIVRGAVSDEMLATRLTGKGCSQIERHEIRASVKDRLRAAELLLKVQGAFDKSESKSSGAEWFAQELEKAWASEPADAC